MRITRWPTAAVLFAMAATAYAGDSSNDVPYPLPMPLMAVPQNLGAHVRADLLLKRMTQDEKLQFIHSEYQMSAVPRRRRGLYSGRAASGHSRPQYG